MQKADLTYRVLAKLIDLILVGFVVSLNSIEALFGVIAGAVYLLICDGFFNGQSLGKKLLKLQVRAIKEDGTTEAGSFKDSIIRNLPIALLLLCSAIPFLGVIFIIVSIIYVILESYFMFSDPKGIRIGDVYAETQVVTVDSK